mmetsp:Transcript_3895/g.12616  ORF Transcript_3895/g.12616 Transcript_3895/m.12616 type:complete len:256 (+) Transcript_3895:235-1002(+)
MRIWSSCQFLLIWMWTSTLQCFRRSCRSAVWCFPLTMRRRRLNMLVTRRLSARLCWNSWTMSRPWAWCRTRCTATLPKWSRSTCLDPWHRASIQLALSTIQRRTSQSSSLPGHTYRLCTNFCYGGLRCPTFQPRLRSPSLTRGLCRRCWSCLTRRTRASVTTSRQRCTASTASFCRCVPLFARRLPTSLSSPSTRLPSTMASRNSSRFSGRSSTAFPSPSSRNTRSFCGVPFSRCTSPSLSHSTTRSCPTASVST